MGRWLHPGSLTHGQVPLLYKLDQDFFLNMKKDRINVYLQNIISLRNHQNLFKILFTIKYDQINLTA